MSNKRFFDAVYVLENTNLENLNLQQTDSLNYLIGSCYFRAGVFSKASRAYKKVKQNSIFHYPSVFYNSFSQIMLNNYDTARISIEKETIPVDSTDLKQFMNLNLAGIDLLKKDLVNFEKDASGFAYEDNLIGDEQKNFINYYKLLKNQKKRSPLAAGLLSALVPGLGKVYAGNNGQALATFITVASLGFSTYESYARLGAKSPQFIILGGIFSAFYIGNIWGSIFSVKITRDEKINEVNYNVMVGLQLSLHKFYK